MRYIVAIDWKASHKSGFNFVELAAKNLKDAMIEAPATAARYCKTVAGLSYDLENVYDLHLLTQTKAQAAEGDAMNTFMCYIPAMHTWLDDDLHILDHWRSVYVEQMSKENEQ